MLSRKCVHTRNLLNQPLVIDDFEDLLILRLENGPAVLHWMNEGGSQRISVLSYCTAAATGFQPREDLPIRFCGLEVQTNFDVCSVIDNCNSSVLH